MRTADSVKIVTKIDDPVPLRVEHHALRVMRIRGNVQPFCQQSCGFSSQRTAGV